MKPVHRPKVVVKGIKSLAPGDVIFLYWRGLTDDQGRQKAMEVMHKLYGQGVIPLGVTICTVPQQFNMEVMDLQSITETIEGLNDIRDIMLKSMKESNQEA